MVAELKSLGTRKVRLLPFLLVAGGHAENDIAGAAPESWKSTLEREGFEVEVQLRGLGETEGIVSILLEHSRSALLKMEEGEEEGRRKIDNRTGIELRRKNDGE